LSLTFAALFNALFHFLAFMKLIVSFALAKSFLLSIFEASTSVVEIL